MRLKTELRKLRVLGCEPPPKPSRYTSPTTRHSIRKKSARSSRPKNPVSPLADGRLTRRALETEALSNGLVLADTMLDELSKCLKDGGKD